MPNGVSIPEKRTSIEALVDYMDNQNEAFKKECIDFENIVPAIDLSQSVNPTDEVIKYIRRLKWQYVLIEDKLNEMNDNFKNPSDNL